jgi:hypothetical protein
MPLCTQPNDKSFDRANHRERTEETRTSLTERAVAITQDNQVKTFSLYYNVVSPVSPSSYKQLLRREGDCCLFPAVGIL